LLVDVKVSRKTRLLSLPEMRADRQLEGLLILKRGNRLSITPVEPRHEARIRALLEHQPVTLA
jgi:predicted RNA-binding protein with PUA-like domain